MSGTIEFDQYVNDLYDAIGLRDKMSYTVFWKAMIGYHNISMMHEDIGHIIAVADFRQPNREKRFYVIDLEELTLLYQTTVAHGVKSGNVYPIAFSNELGSHRSSLGFYLTAETYTGANGVSLRMDGLDDSNSNARNRDVVIHGADYVDDIEAGPSKGCIALPKYLSKQIIPVLAKGRNIVFVYSRFMASDYLDHDNAIKHLKVIRASEALNFFLYNE